RIDLDLTTEDIERGKMFTIKDLSKSFQGRHCLFRIVVSLGKSKICRQEGTGEFVEKMKWICD
ncbi:MAG: hypothetical protein Q8K02_00605, partial [Flavobacterium sp.]|nr:hypothetical protein [Flavobacterium sp.]